MLDSGCLILEKSFTAEDADFAEKAAKSTDFEGEKLKKSIESAKIGGCPYLFWIGLLVVFYNAFSYIVFHLFSSKLYSDSLS